jgi:2'-5' RNA ligase
VIIVSVPEAEPCVAPLRQRCDPAARRGLGAHITVLYPFMAPEHIDRAVLGQLAAVAAATAPFSFHLTHVARFPGTLYLAPEPAAPFVELNARLLRQFPALRPQRSRAEVLVPHLSVVRDSDADDRAVEAQLDSTLRTHGPIACRCRELVLIENSSGMWRPVQSFTLTAPAPLTPPEGPCRMAASR